MEDLETNKEEYKIESYGIRDTNLDEIFLKIAKANEDDNQVLNKNTNKIFSEAPEKPKDFQNGNSIKGSIYGKKLYWQQFKAIFEKRYINTIRIG